MKLIVGLGNPGVQYEKTRHNIGFMCIDEISKKFGVELNKNKFDGLYAELKIGTEKVILLKPQSYINLSGEVIRKFVDYYDISINDILIIVDDMDLEAGTYKLRYKGGSAGHNGLKNIEANLGTNEYKRIKIGISNDRAIDTKDYVLGKISKEQSSLIRPIIENIPNIIEDYITLSFDKVMNKYN